MKPFIVLTGHTVIVVLCVLTAMLLNGLLVTTTYSVNGVDVTRLPAAAIVQKLRTGSLVATVHIGPWFEFPLPSLEMGSLLMPATAVLLLFCVYGPGLILPPAKRLLVRLGIAGAFAVATMIAVSQFGGELMGR